MGDKNTAAILAGGIPVVGGIVENALNAASTNRQNRLNRDFAVQMYDKQRGDALTDRDFQNQYDSPAAQMKRYEAAGLNKNLIYGQSNTGAAVRSTPMAQPQTQAPHYDSSFLGKGLMAYFDASLKTAQTNNLEQLTKVAVETASLTAANTVKAKAETMATGANFGKTIAETLAIMQGKNQSAAMFPTTLEKNKAELEKVKQETAKILADKQYTLDQNQRAAAMNAVSVREAVTRILNMEAERAKTKEETDKIQQEKFNLQKDGMIKQYDIILQSQGAHPGDNLLMRLAAKWIHENIPSVLPNY